MPIIKKKPWPSAVFLSSAAHYGDVPKNDGREFCVFGRSNVGKSSFINHLFGNKTLARVSKTPGKTTLANFYRVSDGTVWADLPGYGHAERARSEQIRWSRLVAEYCQNRKNLRGVIWLCDIRHPGLVLDKEAHSWLVSLSLPMLAVLTKADKLPAQRQAAHARQYAAAFGTRQPPVLYSTSTDAARERFWKRYAEWASTL